MAAPPLSSDPQTAAGPVPALGPVPLKRERQRRRSGLHLRQVGGAPAWTAAGSWPRVWGVVAVHGLTLFRRPIRGLDLLLDGRRVLRVRDLPVVAQVDDRVKQVFNLWLDLAGVAPGVHRLVVRPHGLLGRWRQRGRRVVVVPTPAEPVASDAALPPLAGPDLAAAVAALPSVARPARRGRLAPPVERILVVRADQLGDLAVSLPALRHLRRRFPHARVTGLVTAHNAELAEACGLFDAMVVADFPDDPVLGRRAMRAAEQQRLATLLAAERFDVALDLGEGAQSRLLLLLAGAGFTMGFRHGDHQWLSASFDLHARDPASGLETVPPARKLVALVDALAAMLPPTDPAPLPMPIDPAVLARHGLMPGERFLLLHAGARLAYNRWPHIAELIRLLLARTTLPVLLFAHGDWPPLPTDLPPDHAARLRVYRAPLPFAEFDALLAAATVMVGNDSGPKHLAAAHGTKVVSLHVARLNWNEWGQEGDGLILSRRMPCAGCGIGSDGEDCGRDHACLTGITAEEAYAAVASLL